MHSEINTNIILKQQYWNAYINWKSCKWKRKGKSLWHTGYVRRGSIVLFNALKYLHKYTLPGDSEGNTAWQGKFPLPSRILFSSTPLPQDTFGGSNNPDLWTGGRFCFYSVVLLRTTRLPLYYIAQWTPLRIELVPCICSCFLIWKYSSHKTELNNENSVERYSIAVTRKLH